MAEQGRRTLVSEGAHPEEVEVRYSADLRYLRQIHELNLPVDESLAECLRIDDLHARFDALHEGLFGHRLPPKNRWSWSTLRAPLCGPPAPARASRAPG